MTRPCCVLLWAHLTLRHLQLKESMDDADEDDYIDGDEYDFDDPSSEEE